MNDLSFIGTIVGIKGLDGTLKVETQDIYEIETGTKIYIGFSLKFLNEYSVQRWRAKFKRYALLKLYGVDTIQQARSLLEKGIFVNPHFLKKFAKENESGQIIGFAIIDIDTGSNIGEVLGIQPNPGNDLLIVQIREKEVLIPMVKEFILKIDEAKRFVFIKSIDGLFDLNL
ncbi:MAG: ribosome maturation factor RimM [Candidatus Kapaibacteriales bacterium]